MKETRNIKPGAIYEDDTREKRGRVGTKKRQGIK